MGEKASIFQGVQIGVESEAGTPVAASKKLLAVSVVPQPRTEADRFRALGNKYASFVTLNKEWSELAIDGKLTYNEILYLLGSLLSVPTPVQQGVTTAYKWTFISNTSAEDAGKTLTVEQGDANSAWRVAGARVTGLTMTFNRTEGSIQGSAIGEAIETGITLTASPTSLTPKPVLPAQMSFKMADTQAGLAGASAMTRGFSMEFSLTDKIGLAWPVGQDPVTVETEPSIQAKLKLATDTTGMGLIATMRNGVTKWFQIKATGALIESTYYYDFQLDFPAQIEAPGDMGDQEGIYALEYSLIPIHDATWGKSFQIDVIADVSAL
jgi:hypothetical protein